MHTAELLKRIDGGVKGLIESDKWTSYLKVQARFHKYSPFNTWCILWSKPDATRVAGYHTWPKFKRFVKRDEKGIPILAPVSYGKRTKDEDGEDVTRQAVGFKVVYVFDVAQTDGEPLPEIAADLAGDDSTNLDKLVSVAGCWGMSVQYEDMAISTKGYVRQNFDGIVHLNNRTSPAQQAKTLAHELAHTILHVKGAEDLAEPGSDTYQIGELEAESTAFVVLNALGVDTASYSFGYLAVWAGADPDKLSGIIKASAKRIQKAADKMITACGEPTSAELVALAA